MKKKNAWAYNIYIIHTKKQKFMWLELGKYVHSYLHHYSKLNGAELAFITLVMILELEVIIIDKTGSCNPFTEQSELQVCNT